MFDDKLQAVVFFCAVAAFAALVWLGFRYGHLLVRRR